MTTPTPKTRRQLREALKAAQNHRDTWKATADADRKKLNALHEKVAADGWIPVYSHGIYVGEPTPADFTTPDRTAERAAAEAATRRETLEKVIEGLELAEYGYHKPGTYYFGGYTGVDNRAPHERLWADIETALEVRAEKKREDDRQAVANKVAGLTERKLTLGERLGITIDASAIDASAIRADKIAPVPINIANLLPDPGSSYGSAPKVPETKPKKKPAAKKSSKGASK